MFDVSPPPRRSRKEVDYGYHHSHNESGIDLRGFCWSQVVSRAPLAVGDSLATFPPSHLRRPQFRSACFPRLGGLSVPFHGIDCRPFAPVDIVPVRAGTSGLIASAATTVNRPTSATTRQTAQSDSSRCGWDWPQESSCETDTRNGEHACEEHDKSTRDRTGKRAILAPP